MPLSHVFISYAQLSPRQAGVFRTSQFGPGLTGIIGEALKLVESSSPGIDRM